MKQILQSYKSGELWLAEVPVPALGSKGTIIQTRSSFVSAGTEKMLVDFARKNIVGKALAMPDQVQKVIRKMKSEGIFETLEKVKTKLDQPIPLGYSCAGVIEEIGTGVPGFKIGDRVAAGGAGFANHSEYNYIPKNLLVKIPEGVSFEDASSATVGSIALQGVRQCNLKLGETVCVIGLGLLGMFAVQLFKASGLRVIGFDLDQSRCALAETLGADLCVHSSLENEVESFTQGRGVDGVLITAATKSNEPVITAGEITRMKGVVVVTGLVGMDIPRDMFYKKELDFKLSLSYGPGRYDSNYEEAGNDYPFAYVRWTEQRNIEAFLQLIAQGKVTPGRLITHRFHFENALDAYQLLLGERKEPFLGITLNYPERNLGIPSTERININTAGPKPAKGNIVTGFIGAGNFAKAVLLPECVKHAGYQLEMVCTSTGMNAGETAKKFGFNASTTDANLLLSNEKINTVFVATRHNSHGKFALQVLLKGKNVFVEKPLAIKEDELKELKNALNESKEGILTVGYNRRFSPHAKLIKEYFAKRKTPMTLHYRINAGYISPDIWIQDLEVGGGRILGEVCHFVDVVGYLIGSTVVSVTAICTESDNVQEINEDNVAITLKYRDGSIANIMYVAQGSDGLAKEYCEVFASGSTAVLDNYRHTRCFGKLGKTSLKGKQEKGFSEELAAFAQSILKSGKLPIPYESLFETSEITFRCLESLKTGKTIKI